MQYVIRNNEGKFYRLRINQNRFEIHWVDLQQADVFQYKHVAIKAFPDGECLSVELSLVDREQERKG